MRINLAAFAMMLAGICAIPTAHAQDTAPEALNNLPVKNLPVVDDTTHYRIGVVTNRLEGDAESVVRIREALEGSPASTAGVQVDDVIVSYNGKTVNDRDHLIELVQQAGDHPAPMVVLRDGKNIQLQITADKVQTTPARISLETLKTLTSTEGKPMVIATAQGQDGTAVLRLEQSIGENGEMIHRVVSVPEVTVQGKAAPKVIIAKEQKPEVAIVRAAKVQQAQAATPSIDKAFLEGLKTKFGEMDKKQEKMFHAIMERLGQIEKKMQAGPAEKNHPDAARIHEEMMRHQEEIRQQQERVHREVMERQEMMRQEMQRREEAERDEMRQREAEERRAIERREAEMREQRERRGDREPGADQDRWAQQMDRMQDLTNAVREMREHMERQQNQISELHQQIRRMNEEREALQSRIQNQMQRMGRGMMDRNPPTPMEGSDRGPRRGPGAMDRPMDRDQPMPNRGDMRNRGDDRPDARANDRQPRREGPQTDRPNDRRPANDRQPAPMNRGEDRPQRDRAQSDRAQSDRPQSDRRPDRAERATDRRPQAETTDRPETSDRPNSDAIRQRQAELMAKRAAEIEKAKAEASQRMAEMKARMEEAKKNAELRMKARDQRLKNAEKEKAAAEEEADSNRDAAEKAEAAREKAKAAREKAKADQAEARKKAEAKKAKAKKDAEKVEEKPETSVPVQPVRPSDN